MNQVTNPGTPPQLQSHSDSDDTPRTTRPEIQSQSDSDETPRMNFDFLKEGHSYQKPITNQTLRQGLRSSGDYHFEPHERPEFKFSEVYISVPFRIPVETKIGPFRFRGTKEGSIHIKLGTTDDFIDYPWTESHDYPIEFDYSPRVILLRSHEGECWMMDRHILYFLEETNPSPTRTELVEFLVSELGWVDVEITKVETKTVVYPEEVSV